MMIDIAKNLRALRVNRHWSQAKLAEELGVTRQTVSSWERAVSFPDIEMLKKLSHLYGVGIDEILGGYPSIKHKKFVSNPFTAKFFFLSILVYFVLLTWGGSYIAIPLFRKLVGGGIDEEFIFVIYWGLILLVGYIALCARLLSDQLQTLYQNGFSVGRADVTLEDAVASESGRET